MEAKRPVITAREIRAQKAVNELKPEWPANPTPEQIAYRGNIAEEFTVEWTERTNTAAKAVDQVFKQEYNYERTDAAVEELMKSIGAVPLLEEEEA